MTKINLSFGAYSTLTPGSYQSGVDGFAIGIVNGTTEAGYAWISGSCGPVTMVASGGTLVFTTGILVAFGGSFTLPVPANQEFSVGSNPLSGQPATPTADFYWLPNSDSDAAAVPVPKKR